MDKEQALKFLKEFMTEIKEQDNRSTATPYFYVIRTAKWVSSYHEGEGDRILYVEKEDPESNFSVESTEEGKEHFVELEIEHCDTEEEVVETREKYDEMDDWDLEREIESKYDVFWEKKEWEERCCFFTDREAKAHLKANHYHYSHDAHTYVKHFWRASGVKKFFEAVSSVCGI